MSDLISRESVISLIRDENSALRDIFISHSAGEDLIKWVNELPSVQPIRPQGHWKPIGYDGYADGYPVIDEWECSECGYEHYGDDDTLTAFCPGCGAKMEEQE